jgi:hypothetical protein
MDRSRARQEPIIRFRPESILSHRASRVAAPITDRPTHWGTDVVIQPGGVGLVSRLMAFEDS